MSSLPHKSVSLKFGEKLYQMHSSYNLSPNEASSRRIKLLTKDFIKRCKEKYEGKKLSKFKSNFLKKIDQDKKINETEEEKKY